MDEKVLLGHGSGGTQTNKLIKDTFLKYFNNDILSDMEDAAEIILNKSRVAFTTDSFVVKPIFFNGGNIGKLAVCGTVNDLAVSGSKPLYLSSSFIIEEGFEISKLETIVRTMAEEAKKAGVQIVTGDTKVVERGSVDKIFINTTGVGLKYDNISIKAKNAKVGDVIIVNGTLGDHGMTIMCERNNLGLSGSLKSDCACLNSLVDNILNISNNVHVMRDATRGGVAAVLNEISEASKVSIALMENAIPVTEEVRGVSELLGMDPLYIANEGKLCVFVAKSDAAKVLEIMKKHPLGKDAAIIGEVVDDIEAKVYMNTLLGGKRIISMPSGEQLPRIC